MAAVFVVFVGRLVLIQAFEANSFSAASAAETDNTVVLRGERGTIYDRFGSPVAISVPESEVIADPFQISDPRREAAILGPVLGLPSAPLVAAMSEHSGYALLDRFAGSKAAARVAALHLAGITESPTSQRFTPDGSLLQPVLGVLNTAGEGTSGLEYQWNSTLSGHPGSEVLEESPLGQPLPGGVLEKRPPVTGTGIELTIDPVLQLDAYKALAAEVVKSGATQGMVLVLNTQSGGILAAVNLVDGPGVGSSPVPAPSALAFTQVFEPGSMMKLTTFSGALTKGIITPTTTETVPDQLMINGDLFHDADYHPTETLTATQVIDQSSNVGTIKIAQRLGDAAVYQWIRNFGFGDPTGLHYPGDSPGIVNPVSHWSPTAIGSTPIGQDEAVSALQMADAYSTLANGGVFTPPHLVDGTVGPGGHLHRFTAVARHRVISTTVASTLTSMLRGVVSAQGTAPAAAIPGYSVVGKTGTAQVPSTDHPGYITGDYFGSFVGFAPTQHPVITAIVVLKHPEPIYGGSVAAPVFSTIVGEALHLFGVPPTSAG